MWDISKWDMIWAFIKHYGIRILFLLLGIGIGVAVVFGFNKLF